MAREPAPRASALLPGACGRVPLNCKLSIPSSYLGFLFPESDMMSEARDCVVKLVDDHGVEHSVRVRAESVYEAALKGLQKLERVGGESNGEQIGWVTVEFGKNQLDIGFTSGKCSDG